MEYSQIILEKMSSQNISAYKLARATGISESLFSKWKKKPTSDIASSNLARIADCLNCSVDSLLGRDEQQKKPTLVFEDRLNEELIDRLCRLTPEELEKVDAFVQGILASR